MSKPEHTVHLRNLGAPRQTHVASATTPKAKIAIRNQIQQQIEEFLASGGIIERPPLQDRTQRLKPRFDARCTPVANP